MKSMPILFAAAAALALYLGGAGLGASGRSVLVSSAVSPETWMRACSYVGPGGLRKVEVDAGEACLSAPGPDPAALVRQARLAP